MTNRETKLLLHIADRCTRRNEHSKIITSLPILDQSTSASVCIAGGLISYLPSTNKCMHCSKPALGQQSITLLQTSRYLHCSQLFLSWKASELQPHLLIPNPNEQRCARWKESYLKERRQERKVIDKVGSQSMMQRLNSIFWKTRKDNS